MIDNVKQAIVNKLAEIYPKHTIYDEDIPQNFKTPSFLVALTDQDYDKRIRKTYKSLISFDVAYFSSAHVTDIKSDYLNAQLDLFRAFDLVGTFRVLNKQARITDNVLHFTFDINYSEMIAETGTAMQTQTTNTNL